MSRRWGSCGVHRSSPIRHVRASWRRHLGPVDLSGALDDEDLATDVDDAFADILSE